MWLSIRPGSLCRFIPLTAFGLVLLSAAAAPATILYVPYEYGSIQEAINYAANGDTVLVWPGTYTGPQNRNLHFLGKNLLVVGYRGAAYTLLDGGGTDDPAAVFSATQTRATRFEGFTLLRFSHPREGGAMLINGGSPVIRDVVFSECGERSYGDVLNAGGAVYCWLSASPRFEACVFLDCGYDEGGAVYVASGVTELADCRFERCEAIRGGGFYVGPFGSLVATDTRFTACKTALVWDTFSDAYFGGAGGAGIVASNASSSGIATLVDCEIADCWSSYAWDTQTGGHGGALYGARLALEGVLIRACSGYREGAIKCFDSSTFVRTTIADCTGGDCIAWFGAGASISESIVARNQGPAIYADAPEVVVSCSDVWGNSGGNYTGMIGDQTGLNGNISEDPRFCGDNLDAEAPYGLASDSPCAAGNNGCAVDMGAQGITCPVVGISGRVMRNDGSPHEEVVLISAVEADTTDAQGVYRLRVPLAWAGTVTPTLAGYLFTPDHREYSNLAEYCAGEDYVSVPAFSIAGRVHPLNGEAVDGVVLHGAPDSLVTDASGSYALIVPQGWSGTITPEKPGYVFNPPSRDYADVSADHPQDDYDTWIASWLVTLHRVPADYPDLESAFQAATRGDTILVAPGLYTGPANRNLHWGDLDLLLMSEAGAAGTVVDLEGAGRFVTMENAGSAERLVGFTIRNGRAEAADHGGSGGGLFLTGSSPALEDLVLEDCVAAGGDGGGIYCGSGLPTLAGLVLQSNRAVGSGSDGGGLYAVASAPSIASCCFWANHAGRHGGAIAISSSPSPTQIEQVTIADNFSGGKGGGVFCGWESQLAATGLLLTGNQAAADGGGVAVFNAFTAQPAFSCSDLFGNQPNAVGAGIDDPIGVNGNLAVDPRYCDAAAHDYALSADSPCLPANNDCGLLIGMYGLGCDATPTVLLEFSATPEPGRATLAWRLVDSVPVADLRLEATSGDRIWTVSCREVAASSYLACDESERLRQGALVQYALFAAESPGSWQLLRSLSVRVPAVGRTRWLGASPNPFNPSTELAFELARESAVTLAIYSASGRCVAELLKGQRLTAGRHCVHWEGADTAGHPLPSGLYLLRFVADGQSEGARLILLK